MLGLNRKLLDFIYPVGSYYETSDTLFNPNAAWGGTWVEDTKGRVTVALESDDSDFDTLGKTGGGKQIMIPMQWYTDFIDMRLKTGLNIPNWENFRKNASGATAGGMSETSASAVMGINENTTVDTNGNLQPYVVVKRWHRTA